jgi:hypothetical protein
MKRLSLLQPRTFAFALLTLGSVERAVTMENGQTAYPSGINTVLAAIVPPSGETEEEFYALALTASNLVGNAGKNQLPGFDLAAVGAALRTLHTWNFTADELQFTSGISVVFEDVHTQVPDASFQVVSLNELFIEPLVISKQFGSLHTFVAEDVFVPAGQHTPANLASTSIGYYSFNTMAAATWLPDPHWDLSTWWSYGITTRDIKTQYKSGDSLNIDYGANYRPLLVSLPQFEFGICGYFVKQFSDDTLNGMVYNNGNRLRQLGIGPSAAWFFGPATGIVVKWQHEMLSENTAQGNRFWFEFAIPL